MINGGHVIIFSQDAEADRAFFRDILNLPNVDAGGGWLIFKLPPAELAFHPADAPGSQPPHEFYLLCDDIEETVRTLAARGVEFSQISEERWGRVTRLRLPGGGEVGVYEPRHELAIEL